MKRLLAELLSAVLLLSLLPAMAWAAGFEGAASGSGTDGDPYLISTAEQLKKLSQYVNGGNNCQDTYFELTADINLEGSADNQWTPIGNQSNKFQGTFDGNNHTISGLYIDKVDENLGLFGYIDDQGRVKNLGVSGSIKGGSYSYMGGIAGTSNGAITGCHSACEIEGGDYAGGIVGYNRGGSVSDCYNTGSISGAARAGGIVGHNSGNISDCYNAGAVSGKTHAGGIVGNYTGVHTFENCYNVGQVTGAGSRGGIAGRDDGAEHSTYENCYFLAGTADNGVGSDTGGTTGVESKSEDDFKSLATELGGAFEDDPFLGRPVLKTNKEPWPISGEGTADAPFEIPDKETLENFRNYVNAGNNCEGMYFKVTADIDLLGEEWTPIGSSSRSPFQGTFDGGSFTVRGLSISSGSYVGLFGYLGEGGTVKNLTVEGNVTGSSYVGGIVGQSNRGIIENCHNAATVTSTEQAGGIVGFSSGGTVTNCYNTAAVTGSSQYIGGIVGYNVRGTVTDCCNTATVTGQYLVGGIAGENSSGMVTNCYYLDTTLSGVGAGDGSGTTPKTEADFASGEVAWLLQEGQGTQVWGQTVDSGYPELTAETGKTVYKVTFQSDGTECAVKYANPAGLTELPADPEKAGYTFEGWSTTSGGSVDFTARTPISGDMTVYAVWKVPFEGSGTAEDPYRISDKEELKAFRDYVNAGHNCAGLHFKLTADIDLENELWTPIGVGYGTTFNGTFDGGGHSISGLNVNTRDYAGLFGVVYNGHIKNLTVAGTVTSTGGNDTGGIVGTLGDYDAMDGSVTNCHSSVTVTGSGGYTGGIVGQKYGSTVSGCVNTGAVSDSDGDAGGIAGANFGGAIENCYNTGDVFGGWRAGGIAGSNSGREWTAPAEIISCYNTGTVSGGKNIGGILGSSGGSVTNCYYLDTCGAAGLGTAKTAEEFASGEVAYLLQAGQSAQEPLTWGQGITNGGTDPLPILTDEAADRVYQVTFRADLMPEYEKTLYANPGGTLPEAETLKPEKEGYTFVKWALNNSPDGEAFTASTQVNSDLTLYAIFEEKATEPTPTESKEPEPSKGPETSEGPQNPTGGPSGEGSNDHPSGTPNDTPKTGDEGQLFLWLALTLLSLAGAAVTAPIMGRKRPTGPRKGNDRK